MSNNPANWAEQTRQFLSEVQVEFKKVTWPTQKETVAGAISVATLSILMGIVLFLVDWAVGGVLGLLWN